MDKKIKLIIFDWGGVIFKDGFTEALKFYATMNNKTIEDYNKFIHQFDNFGYKDAWWLHSTGRISEKDYWSKLRQNIKNTRVVMNIKNWNYNFTLPVYGTVQIIKNLKKENYFLALLTNHTKEWFSYYDKTSVGREIHGYFDEIINSAHIGYKKPSPRIYEMVFLKTGFKPEEAIFIDNTEQNVKAAQELGIDSIFFINPSQLRKDLALRGVLL